MRPLLLSGLPGVAVAGFGTLAADLLLPFPGMAAPGFGQGVALCCLGGVATATGRNGAKRYAPFTARGSTTMSANSGFPTCIRYILKAWKL